MKKFLTEDFLLENSVSEELYHDYARDMPIIDYHCHLSPHDIATNRVFNNITEAWLEGDHYKWRAMRTNGVDESYITGDKSDQEKFQKWSETVPYTFKNPLYHWTHLELKRYFDIEQILEGSNGKEIFQETEKLISNPDYSCQELLRKMNVKVVCSTDDPTDSLEYHIKAQQDGLDIQLLPTFRPDKLYAIRDCDTFITYCKKLGDVTGIEIKSFNDLIAAAEDRINFFDANGCRLSDHGIDQLYDVNYSPSKAEAILKKVTSGQAPTEEETQVFQMAVLFELCKLYSAKGWTQQLHLGAIRNNNTRMMGCLGPDTGFDSIGDFSQVKSLSKFLDRLDSTDELAKTILYNLNPSNNEAMATMIGNFNDGSVAGKMQYGSAWWFLDQKDGMTKQMNALANMGLLSRFVGMLTDSRSFLSYPRHEYFRRILCNMIGQDVVNGELPYDVKWLGEMVQNICYHNAKHYFNF